MLRLSPWRVAGLGLALASAAGVAVSVGLGVVFGVLWGFVAYAATVLLLLGVVGVAMRFAPAAASEIEPAVGPMVDAGVAAPPAAPAAELPPARRLSDKVTSAFEHACRIGDLALAEKLLESLELLLLRGPSAVEERALKLEAVIAGRNRLAALRSAGGTGGDVKADGAVTGGTVSVEG